MTTGAPPSLAAALETVAASLPKLFVQACAGRPEQRIVRVETPVDLPRHLLGLLAGTSPGVRHYWRDRRGHFEAVGLGAAATFTGRPGLTMPAVQRLLADADDAVRVYGGAAFAPSSAEVAAGGAWEAFGPSWFVLPLVEFRHENGHAFVAVQGLPEGPAPPESLARDAADTLHAVARACDAASNGEPASRAFHVTQRTDSPDYDGWCRMVRRALDRIRSDAFAKVVLARETRFRLDAAPDPFEIARRLSATATHAYQFCFQPREGCAFVGATPEQLYRRRGAMLRTEAVAGTRPRGAAKAEDAAFAQALLRSGKDRREHRFVADAILGVLDDAGATIVNKDDVSVLPLPTCQHLYQPIKAALPGHLSDADLLHRLHPTPAVGGFPSAESIRAIAELEPFERGWYAGPVGWLSRRSAEFAVAIRSGLVTGEEVTVLSGAGIVEGSTPDDEWREIETKMTAFLSVLAGAP